MDYISGDFCSLALRVCKNRGFCRWQPRSLMPRIGAGRAILVSSALRSLLRPAPGLMQEPTGCSGYRRNSPCCCSSLRDACINRCTNPVTVSRCTVRVDMLSREPWLFRSPTRRRTIRDPRTTRIPVTASKRVIHQKKMDASSKAMKTAGFHQPRIRMHRDQNRSIGIR